MAFEILVVDDEKDIRSVLTDVLEDNGYAVRCVVDGPTAIEAVREKRPSLILLDIWLGDSRFDGIKALDIIHEEYPSVPVLMMSGHGNIKTAVTAIKKGAYDFIEKPFKSDRLLFLIQRALEVSQLREENEALKQETQQTSFHELIGDSAYLNQMRQLIAKVAPTNSRIFITGSSGSGKELIAREIHKESTRSGACFSVLNCSTLNPERFEEELFGIEGSDTTPQKQGILEKSHLGTLLFDQIHDMPLVTQGKLARFLQEGAIQRIGGDRPFKVDVRVIAATNEPTKDMLDKGKLREDLYYRLNVVPIQVKPLKDRKEDISELAQYFLNQSSQTYGTPNRSLSAEAMTALRTYDWPGNIRQLRNIMDWVVIMAKEAQGPITPEMLPPDISASLPSTGSVNKNDNEALHLTLKDAREVFEKNYLVSQVARFSGNISQTAEFIGMERSALHRKLRALGVSRKEG